MSPIPFASALKPTGELFRKLTTVKVQEAKVRVALDIGSTSIKGIALGPRVKGSDSRSIVARNMVALAPEEADASEAMKRAVDGLQLAVPARSVNLSVSGPWVIMRIVEMPIMKPSELRQALSFEAQRYLPFSIQEVVVDGAVLGSVDAKKTWVLIVACKKELLERRIDWAKRAGLEVTLIDVDALALANGFLASKDGKRAEGTRALANVGAQLTSLVIFQGAVPYLVRDIPWGAERLIRSVAEQVGLSPEEAQAALAQAEAGPELKSALKLGSEGLVTELQLSFDYFENRFGQPPEEIFVTGGLGQSALFLEILKTHLIRAITSWTPAEGLSGQFAVAYGLALRSD